MVEELYAWIGKVIDPKVGEVGRYEVIAIGMETPQGRMMMSLVIPTKDIAVQFAEILKSNPSPSHTDQQLVRFTSGEVIMKIEVASA